MGLSRFIQVTYANVAFTQCQTIAYHVSRITYRVSREQIQGVGENQEEVLTAFIESCNSIFSRLEAVTSFQDLDFLDNVTSQVEEM